jgi:hypothetical protein
LTCWSALLLQVVSFGRSAVDGLGGAGRGESGGEQHVPGDHPSHQRGHLQPSIRAAISRHAKQLVGQPTQTRPLGETNERHQPGRDTPLGSSNTAATAENL